MEEVLLVLCPLCAFITLLVLVWYLIYGFPRVMRPWLEANHVGASRCRFLHLTLLILYILISYALIVVGAAGALGETTKEQVWCCAVAVGLMAVGRCL